MKNKVIKDIFRDITEEDWNIMFSDFLGDSPENTHGHAESANKWYLVLKRLHGMVNCTVSPRVQGMIDFYERIKVDDVPEYNEEAMTLEWRAGWYEALDSLFDSYMELKKKLREERPDVELLLEDDV